MSERAPNGHDEFLEQEYRQWAEIIRIREECAFMERQILMRSLVEMASEMSAEEFYAELKRLRDLWSDSV